MPKTTAEAIKKRIKIVKRRLLKTRLQFQQLKQLKRRINRKAFEARKLRYDVEVQDQIYHACKQQAIEKFEADTNILNGLLKRLENLENKNPEKSTN